MLVERQYVCSSWSQWAYGNEGGPAERQVRQQLKNTRSAFGQEIVGEKRSLFDGEAGNDQVP